MSCETLKDAAEVLSLTLTRLGFELWSGGGGVHAGAALRVSATHVSHSEHFRRPKISSNSQGSKDQTCSDSKKAGVLMCK